MVARKARGECSDLARWSAKRTDLASAARRLRHPVPQGKDRFGVDLTHT